MDFDEAKELLKKSYTQAGLSLIDERQKELFFQPAQEDRFPIRISEQEILEFAEFMRIRQSFEKTPTECSICSNDYREQIITPYDPRRMFPQSDRFQTLFGEQSAENIYVEISPASMIFINFFRFDETYLPFSLERINRPYVSRNDRNSDMSEALFKPLTIKVINLSAQNIETAVSHSSQLIDACLFELSYLKNTTLKLEENWPFRRPRVRPFRYEELVRGNQLPFPQVKYNPDVIRFYQRSMGSDDPVNQFLSYYHVLEYFFMSVSDEQLYSKLARRINDPRFSPNPTSLDRIIQDTLSHKRETDETEMMKFVLKKYTNEDEIIDFIKAYEEYLEDRIYTKRRMIFDEPIEIKLEPGQVISNLAKRIKVIRNALVHSSDRFERQQRYIPTADAEKIIKQEIPLMKYLAERIIIATSS